MTIEATSKRRARARALALGIAYLADAWRSEQMAVIGRVPIDAVLAASAE